MNKASPSSPAKRQFDSGLSSPRGTNNNSLDLGELEQFLKEDFDVPAFTREAMNSDTNLRSLKNHLETVERAISSSVVTHEDSLLGTLECVTNLKKEMIHSKTDSSALVNSVRRVEHDFNEPLERLRACEQSLANAHMANGLLRKLGWFLQARKKLKLIPMEDRGGKEAARAAQLIGELEDLIQDGTLLGVHIVDQDIKWIRESGTKVRQDTQRCLEQAIKAKNQSEIALALQAFFYLNVLEDRVNSTVNVWAIKEFTQDVRELLKEGDGTLAQLRMRMDRMMETTLRGWAVQIWNLQRVLINKRFPAMKTTTTTPQVGLFDQFWQKCCSVLEQEIKTCNRFTKESLIEDYPRLRKSARAMLHRLWTSTNNVLGKKSSAAASTTMAVGGAKESQALMRALHPLLAEFLARSMSRLNQPVHVMFPAHSATLDIAGFKTKPIPTMHDVTTFAQILHKELLLATSSSSSADAFVDNELLGAITKPCSMALQLFCEKCEAALSKSESAHQFRGLNAPTASSNASSAPAVTRTPAQEHNMALLQLVSTLVARMCETCELFQEKCSAQDAAATGEVGAATEEDMESGNNSELDDTIAEDDDEDEEANDDAPRAQAATPVLLNSFATLQRLLDAVQSLEALELEMLHDYLGNNAEFAFRALDEVLQEVNHSGITLYQTATATANKQQQQLPANSFAVRFQRAIDIFAEEHLAKLPAQSQQVNALRIVLHARLTNRLAMRVCNLRCQFSTEGRALLVREIQIVVTSLSKVHSTGSSKVAGLPLALEQLIAQKRTPQELLSSGQLSRVLVWHYLYSTSLQGGLATGRKPEGPNRSLTQYLNEIEFQSEQEVRDGLEKCLPNNVDQVLI